MLLIKLHFPSVVCYKLQTISLRERVINTEVQFSSNFRYGGINFSFSKFYIDCYMYRQHDKQFLASCYDNCYYFWVKYQNPDFLYESSYYKNLAGHSKLLTNSNQRKQRKGACRLRRDDPSTWGYIYKHVPLSKSHPSWADTFSISSFVR